MTKPTYNKLLVSNHELEILTRLLEQESLNKNSSDQINCWVLFREFNRILNNDK